MLINFRLVRMCAAGVLIILLLVLFIGGHQPASGKLFPAPWDKLAHFIFYGSLTIVTGTAFPKIRLPLLFLIIIGIGGADEIHQTFVPGRHPGLDDLIADAIGCLSALFSVVWIRRKFEGHFKSDVIVNIRE